MKKKRLCKNTYLTMYNLLTKYVFSNRDTSIIVEHMDYKRRRLNYDPLKTALLLSRLKTSVEFCVKHIMPKTKFKYVLLKSSQ